MDHSALSVPKSQPSLNRSHLLESQHIKSLEWHADAQTDEDFECFGFRVPNECFKTVATNGVYKGLNSTIFLFV